MKKVTYGFAVIIGEKIVNVRTKEEKPYDMDEIIDAEYKHRTLREIITQMRKKEKGVETGEALDVLLNPPTRGIRLTFKVNAYPVTLDQTMQDNLYVEESYGDHTMDTLNVTCVVLHDPGSKNCII